MSLFVVCCVLCAIRSCLLFDVYWLMSVGSNCWLMFIIVSRVSSFVVVCLLPCLLVVICCCWFSFVLFVVRSLLVVVCCS